MLEKLIHYNQIISNYMEHQMGLVDAYNEQCFLDTTGQLHVGIRKVVTS